MNRVHWPAVRAGALVAIAVCLPLAVAGTLLVDTDDDDPSSMATLFYVAVLVGFAIGGWVAARRAVDMPYSSGAIAALLAYVVIAVVSVISNAVKNDDINVVVLVANGFLAYGAGLLGGGIAARRAT